MAAIFGNKVTTSQLQVASTLAFCTSLAIVAWSLGSKISDPNSWESLCHKLHNVMELASFAPQKDRYGPTNQVSLRRHHRSLKMAR